MNEEATKEVRCDSHFRFGASVFQKQKESPGANAVLARTKKNWCGESAKEGLCYRALLVPSGLGLDPLNNDMPDSRFTKARRTVGRRDGR